LPNQVHLYLPGSRETLDGEGVGEGDGKLAQLCIHLVCSLKITGLGGPAEQ
jgi:hypothetical protein